MGLSSKKSMGKYWEVQHQKNVGEHAYFLRWSPWGLVNRWVITWQVPAQAGVFQIWKKKGSNLELLHTGLSYYGGLRATLREAIDELAPAGKPLRMIMGGRECWFRYSLITSRTQVKDLHSWCQGKPLESTNEEILVAEVETLRRFKSPPPDLADAQRTQRGDNDYSPPLPDPGSR